MDQAAPGSELNCRCASASLGVVALVEAQCAALRTDPAEQVELDWLEAAAHQVEGWK